MRISESQIRQKWEPLIESNKNLKFHEGNESVKEWLPIYSHYHKLTEKGINEAANATLSNTVGMGAIKLPGNYTGQNGFHGQTPGSGDKISSYLTLSQQIAADTIGFQCVPVVPATGLITVLTYADVIYANGDINSETQLPDIFAIDIILPSEAKPGGIITLSNATEVKMNLVFIGRSRLDGMPICLFKNAPNGAISIKAALAAAAAVGDTASTFNDDVERNATKDVPCEIKNDTPRYVKALEDHVSGFSGQLFARLREASSPAVSVEQMVYKNQAYSREEGETTHSRSLNWQFYNKTVKPQTWNVDIAVTREQLDDSKALGYDILSKAQKLLVNETTQSYNKNILDRIFALGAKHHKQIFDSEGLHFNVNYDNDPTSTGGSVFVLGWDNVGNLTTITSQTPKSNTQVGGETLMSTRHKIMDQILLASNTIARRGRREAADCIVTNMALGTFIQTLPNFVPMKVPNTISQKTGLSSVGTVYGMTVFIDPNMPMADTRIAVFRKGDGDSGGLIFMPYRLADVVETIAEGTMAPKMQLKSRGSLVEAGHNPHLFYITLKVNATNLFR